MTALTIYQVDAFTDRPFQGNPAAVMPLRQWSGDALLQSLAQENNLSETAFLVPCARGFELRWFTPLVEVDLCGHATLAAAHVLFEHRGYASDELVFETRSGDLRVTRHGASLTMDFPASRLVQLSLQPAVCSALGARAAEAWATEQPAGPQLYVFDSEQAVQRLTPDFVSLASATDSCIIVSAPGDDVDVVSRFFGPQVGLDEDPVTGSAHCIVAPYWAARLGKQRLLCRQVSERGGELDCALMDGRVFITGTAVTYMIGEVFVDGIS